MSENGRITLQIIAPLQNIKEDSVWKIITKDLDMSEK